jgi:ribonuclease P protein subunit POP4
MRDPKNILRHEFIGLDCEIPESENKAYIGISGKIIYETMKTITIETENGRKEILKKGTIFRIKLGNEKIDISGDYIVARPEDRIKKKFKKW